MGLFQWLPLANGGRWQERFGLVRHHKLKAKRSRRLPPLASGSHWNRPNVGLKLSCTIQSWGLFQWLPLANGGRQRETAVDSGSVSL